MNSSNLFVKAGFKVNCYLVSTTSQDIEDLSECLQGNICRCTGYRPILEAFQKFNETSKKVPFEVSLPKKGNGNFESLILNKNYFAPNNLDEVRKLMKIHMFVSLHQPMTQCERPNFFVLIFVVVAIQKEIRPGSLFFFQMATTKKSKQIDTSHLVFNFLITADATKKNNSGKYEFIQGGTGKYQIKTANEASIHIFLGLVSSLQKIRVSFYFSVSKMIF